MDDISHQIPERAPVPEPRVPVVPQEHQSRPVPKWRKRVARHNTSVARHNSGVVDCSKHSS
jgi:hypothetical protein